MRLPLKLPPAEGTTCDVVAVGESSLDFMGIVGRWPAVDRKDDLEGFASLPGGQAATAAVACARLGWRARYVGPVGDDGAGDDIRAALEREGVERRVRVHPRISSRVAIILVDAHSGRRAVLAHREPGLRLEPTDITPDAIEGARLLIVDAVYPEASLEAARLARSRGVPVIVDVDGPGPVDALLDQVDLLVATAEAVAALAGGPEGEPGRNLRVLARRYRAEVVIATLGAEGSLAICGDREVRCPAVAVDVVDTTGAGDAFRGGLAAAWLRSGAEAELEAVLRYASAVAALNCRALGAQAGLPGREAVERLL